MKVFLTGASGYIGRHVALELLSRGHQVTGMARRASQRSEYSPQMDWCFADLENFSEYAPALELCDCVVHCAMDYSQGGAENADLDTAFIEHLSGSNPHLIYTGNLFTPRQDTHAVLTEIQKSSASGWRFNNEILVLETLPDAAAIRLGFVYGSSGGYLWETLSAGSVFGMNTNEIPEVYWPMVHVKDVASLYATVAESKAIGIFHAYDGTPTTASGIIESVKSVYRDNGITDSDSSDYVNQLLESSIQTTNERSTAAGWTPQYSRFVDHAEQAFQEHRR